MERREQRSTEPGGEPFAGGSDTARATAGATVARAEPAADLRVIVTGPDRDLVALISIARYLTTAQVARLLRPGRHESVVRKRLFRLAGLESTRKRRADAAAPPRAVFTPPFLKRLRFAAALGSRVDIWGLAPRGQLLASDALGVVRKYPKDDVGELFLEHWAALTDLFVALAAPFVHAGLPARQLPFRWLPADGAGLPWEEWDAQAHKARARRIVPDAVLELPAAKRRLFIECEMGSHSIVAASDEKAGATLAKTQRYDEFMAARAGKGGSFYARSFPDGWPAEVLYLVLTEGRAASVNKALGGWRKQTQSSLKARAVTLGQLVDELGPQLGSPPKAAAPTASRGGAALSASEVELLRSFYQDALTQLDEAHLALKRPVPPKFKELAQQLRAVIKRVSAATKGEG